MADLILYRGNSAVTTVSVLNSDGSPMNINGLLSALFLAKESVEDADGDALLTKTIGQGITIADGVNGKLAITFIPDDTRGTRDTLVYALNIVTALLETKTIVSGNLIFKRTAIRGDL